MKKILSVFLILLIITFSCETKKSGKDAPVAESYESKLDSLGHSILDKGGVVGFSIAIMQGNDTVYNRGFGYSDLSKNRPITNNTRFKLASISKLIGSTVVMKLVDEGKLSLDQTLIELLPGFPNQEQGNKITLEHLVSHTSGLTEYATLMDTLYVQTGKEPEKEDYYNFFESNDLNFEPGTNYSYCNSGFVLMGMIVEKISNKDLQEEFDRVINEPTGMDLKLIAEAASYPDMSPYWERKGTKFISYPHWTWIKGDGGLTATSLMLAHFPKLWASGKIISDSSFNEMIKPRVLHDGIQTGYGLGVRNGEFFGERIIGHTGGHKSTYAIMVYFPQRDLTFVVFVNTDNTSNNARKIFGQFAATFLGYDPSTMSSNQQSMDNPELYVGDYSAFDKKIEETITITKSNGELLYCLADECYPMTYLGNHKFWISEWPYDYVAFHVDEKGESLAIKEYYSGFYSVLRKKIN